MFQKKYLEEFGSKNVWQAIRLLFNSPHLSFGITEIARSIGKSKSNVYRALQNLEYLGLVRTVKSGRKKLYRVESSSALAETVWEIVTIERYMNADVSFKNGIDLFIDKIEKNWVKCLLLFGSVAQGLAGKWSDIDFCIVLTESQENQIKKLAKELFPEYRFEIHFYSEQQFESLEDFVVLDALLSGIPLIGKKYVFDIKSDLRKFPRSYLVYRLNNVKDIAKRIERVKGDAKAYFEEVAKIALGEIAAVLERKTIIPKRAISKDIDVKVEIKRLENEIAKRGEIIWLT